MVDLVFEFQENIVWKDFSKKILEIRIVFLKLTCHLLNIINTQINSWEGVFQNEKQSKLGKCKRRGYDHRRSDKHRGN